MNSKGLRTLEYNKILELLKSRAGSPMAKAIVSGFKPLTDRDEILRGLKETTEAVNVIVKKGKLPIGEIYDINNSLIRARKGGSLSMKELLEVLYNLKVTENVKSFLKEDLEEIPIIREMVDLLQVYPMLKDRIDRSILSEDEMADSASSELKNIRRDILRQNEAIRNKLNSIVSSSENSFLQENIVTLRDGRYVVPVKAQYRQKVSGIVHDQSGTGQTLFVEPQAIVELNNKLRELEVAEKIEIEKILKEISENVAEHFKELTNNQRLLIDLDVIFAKGRLSYDMKGAMPNISENNHLNLIRARHPLIDSKKAVPINVAIGKDYDSLVITGPNTGGKTVTIKTIGLLALMVQTGLHIPASENSEMPIFEDVFADIGDEQNIEQSLSTFSSHMKNTVELVEKARAGTLVLLDELGAGTDPTEGAALAIGILEHLKSRGATTVATTHYNELKKYALSTDRVENASMEFDVETLSPTYKLSIGIPGKSNAFEISKKLGLPGQIIDRANQLLKRGDIEFEEVISTIEKDRKLAEKYRIEAENLRSEIKTKEKALEERIAKNKMLQEKKITEAKEEARQIIREAKNLAEDVQKELKNLEKVQSLGERNGILAENKGRLKEFDKRYSQGLVREVNENPVSVNDIKLGDRVKVLTLDQNAEIISLPDDEGTLRVQVGAMKIYVNVSDLMIINQGPGKKAKPNRGASKSGSLFRTKAMSISPSVNVIGKNLIEAIDTVEKYLDDAYIAGLKEVTIVHGRGQGILQKGLRDLLKTHKIVKSYRRGEYNEGGDGVTVVDIKV